MKSSPFISKLPISVGVLTLESVRFLIEKLPKRPASLLALRVGQCRQENWVWNIVKRIDPKNPEFTDHAVLLFDDFSNGARDKAGAKLRDEGRKRCTPVEKDSTPDEVYAAVLRSVAGAV